jgi:hypothetical protein
LGNDATSVFWSVALDADLLRFGGGGGASTESLSGFRPLLFKSHMTRPKIRIMKLTTPKPIPIADAVLICVVGARLESPGEPKGAASRNCALLAQSPPVEHVTLGETEAVVVLVTSSSASCGVALGVGLPVSRTIELVWARNVDSGASFDLVVVLVLIADCRLDVVEVGRSVCRVLVWVEDIIIKGINMLI